MGTENPTTTGTVTQKQKSSCYLCNKDLWFQPRAFQLLNMAAYPVLDVLAGPQDMVLSNTSGRRLGTKKQITLPPDSKFSTDIRLFPSAAAFLYHKSRRTLRLVSRGPDPGSWDKLNGAKLYGEKVSSCVRPGVFDFDLGVYQPHVIFRPRWE